VNARQSAKFAKFKRFVGLVFSTILCILAIRMLITARNQSIRFCISLVLVVFLSCGSRSHQIGDAVDSLNHVKVFYNGKISHSYGRNVAANGYNIGQKYQCVEFVKRYYFEYLHHQMPNTYGNAKDFFDPSISDGGFNKARGLQQFSNGSSVKPRVSDLVIFNGHLTNPYGHVAIVSEVTDTEVEIIQQNPGVWGSSRERFKLKLNNQKWSLEHPRLLGWLRK
jgi:surface antigen